MFTSGSARCISRQNVVFLSGTYEKKYYRASALLNSRLIAQTRCVQHTQLLAHYQICGIWTFSFPTLIPLISGFQKLSFSMTTSRNALPLLFILTNTSRGPQQLRNKGLVSHYCDVEGVSDDDFKRPDGTCRILHATEGAATVFSSVSL